jgi:hypothetical protein
MMTTGHLTLRCAQYENGEPCSVCGHTLTVADIGQKASAYPSTVLPQFLYLGSYDNASRSELLKTLGITHILNVCSRWPLCTAAVLYVELCKVQAPSCSIDQHTPMLPADGALLPDAVQELLHLSHRQHLASRVPRVLRVPR